MILREPISDAKRLALTVHPLRHQHPFSVIWFCGKLFIVSYCIIVENEGIWWPQEAEKDGR